MARRLTGTVPVHNEDGTTTWYKPGDKIPADVAKKIGDHAWEDVEDVEESDDDDLELVPPPMSGKGSGDAAWREYAGAVGVAVADDASRGDVVEALKAADKPVDRP